MMAIDLCEAQTKNTGSIFILFDCKKKLIVETMHLEPQNLKHFVQIANFEDRLILVERQ